MLPGFGAIPPTANAQCVHGVGELRGFLYLVIVSGLCIITGEQV